MTEKEVDLSQIKEGLSDLEKAYVSQQDRVLDPSLIDKTLLERMPRPTGWRMLVLPYKGKGRTVGGVYLPDSVVEEANVSTVVGYVLKQGILAYGDKEKFPDGPWCKEKDWVVFARYAGSRMKIEGGEVRMLNDDEILATVDNPEDIIHEF